MNTVTGIAFGVGWPPCAALIARAAFPHSMRGLREVLAFWLTDALVLAVTYAAVRIGSFALGSAASAVIAAVWLWWRHKRPDKAIRALGAKARARVQALARQMPPARIPAPAAATCSRGPASSQPTPPWGWLAVSWRLMTPGRLSSGPFPVPAMRRSHGARPGPLPPGPRTIREGGSHG